MNFCSNRAFHDVFDRSKSLCFTLLSTAQFSKHFMKLLKSHIFIGKKNGQYFQIHDWEKRISSHGLINLNIRIYLPNIIWLIVLTEKLMKLNK